MLLEYKLESTEEALRYFFDRSTIWRDIVTLIFEGIERGRDELEGVDGDSLKLVQGRIAQLRDMLQLPVTMLDKKREQDALSLEKEEEGIQEQEDNDNDS